MASLLSIINSARRNWQYLLPFKRRLGYIGWLGFGNLGDEAMYTAYQKLFSQYNILPFKYTEKIKKLEKITKRRFFHAVQLGGGTLINEPGYLEKIKLAQENAFLTFVLGAGVRNPAFWDTKKQPNYLPEWVECLRKAFYVGVRGPLSKKILAENGFSQTEVTGDPALFFGRDKIVRKKHNKKLGINFGVANGNVWGSEKGIFDFILRLTQKMQADGWEVTYLPVFYKDVSFIEEAARQNRSVKICYDYKSFKKTLDFLEQCDLFIGQKLHSVIFAMCVHTPSIMLEYRPKCLDFMMSMDMEEFTMRTDNLDIEKILFLIDKLENDLYGFQEKIWQKVNFYRSLQIEKAEYIIKYLTN